MTEEEQFDELTKRMGKSYQAVKHKEVISLPLAMRDLAIILNREVFKGMDHRIEDIIIVDGQLHLIKVKK